MPYSSPEFDADVELFMQEHPFETLHDIGCGAGKYGLMASRVRPEARRFGIEVEESYFGRFNLFHIYENVWRMPALDLISNPDEVFDLVILGDSIEHMRKSEGVDLLHFLVYRSKFIIVIFPRKFPQNSWEGVKSEAHISVWSMADFHQFDTRFERRGQMCMATIKGYL